MPIPLPPVIHGPVTPITPELLASGVLKDAKVTIVAKQGASEKTLGTGIANAPGDLWIKLTQKPTVGWEVSALQERGGEQSEPSPQPIVVIDTPLPLATPIIVSELNTCMADVLVDGLTPGATVIASIGSTSLANTSVTRTTQWIGLDPKAAIPHGAVLEIYQQVKSGGQTVKSPVAKSLPISSLKLEKLEPPVIAPPLQGCQTSIDVATVTPGSVFRYENEGMSGTTVSPAASFRGIGFPLTPGKLIAVQHMPRCKLKSKEAIYTVDPVGAPPQPIIQHSICQKVPCFIASQLIPGATLVIVRYVNFPGGSKQFGADHEFGVGNETETIYLGSKGMELTDPGGPVTFGVYQRLCGVIGKSTEVAIAVTGGPYSAPKVVEPVYSCVHALRVTGAHPGAWIQAIDATTKNPLSDLVVTPAGDFLLKLWFPTIAGASIFVRQAGCNADGDSQPVTVKKLPSKLPPPKIKNPVRPGTNVVQLSGVLPGARVFLFVDGVVRAQSECWSDTPTLYIAGVALKEGQKLFAMQTLCDQWSNAEGPSVSVTKGNMNVSVSPSGAIARGVTSQITVSATDADTHAPIALGQILLKGQPIGTTDLPFAYTPPANELSPVPGEVREDVGHYPAAFQIPLTDPNWILRNIAAPTTHLVDGTLQVTIEEATWIITPDWDPSQKKTITKPATPPNIYIDTSLPTPPGNVKTLHVQLEKLKCSTPGGYAFTYVFYPGVFWGIGDTANVAYTGKSLKVSWLIVIEVLKDQYGKPYILPRAKVTDIS